MILLKLFASIFSLPAFVIHNDLTLPQCSIFNIPSFTLPLVTPERMKAELLSLDSNTASGYDNVSALFLVKCADQLCFPLAMIFNLSVKRGEYPPLLKFNNVVPIYKRIGDKNSVSSYRPISMQPVVSKVFEKIVNKALRQHLKGLICDEQYGFVHINPPLPIFLVTLILLQLLLMISFKFTRFTQIFRKRLTLSLMNTFC